jgi:phospholipid/cholesterol/gamma-HCH transport system ATP-binding protein
MRKRVGLARATVAQPDVVLYDEPTAGLDPVTTSKIYELLRADHAGPTRGGVEGEARAERSEDPGQLPEGRLGSTSTAVVVSSDVEAVARFADTIAFLEQGRVRWLGPAAALFDADDAHVRRFARGELPPAQEPGRRSA